MNEVNPYLHRFNVMPDWANELAFLRSEMAKLQGERVKAIQEYAHSLPS